MMNEKLEKQIIAFSEEYPEFSVDTIDVDNKICLEFLSHEDASAYTIIDIDNCEDFRDVANLIKNYADNFNVDKEVKEKLGIEYDPNALTVQEVLDDMMNVCYGLEELQFVMDLANGEAKEHLNDFGGELSVDDYICVIDNNLSKADLTRTDDIVTLTTGNTYSREWDLKECDYSKIAVELEHLYKNFSMNEHVGDYFGVNLEDAEPVCDTIEYFTEFKENVEQMADEMDKFADKLEKSHNKDFER